ncbi:MAG: TonB-dependent receptor, partial [Candidatus Eremiobacteraeota bacterium]|nr:TonB-dependent receptor [Candidatus Eremiobacteraeota bacterium]
ALVALCLPLAAAAQTTRGTVSGTIAADDGTPVAGASITLAGDAHGFTSTANARGRFAFESIPTGTYAVSATAPGYHGLSGRTLDVRAGDTRLDLVLARSSTSSLTTIGQVRVNGAEALSASAAPSVVVDTKAYAAQGTTRVSDALLGLLSTSVVRPLGGGANLPAVIALRGPDPTETLVDVDGHAVNNGSTGDFDLSLLDPADFQSVQVVYGIAPSSLVGPNTLGGAINIRTLEPTATSHALVRGFAGSFSSFAGTLQATGTSQRLGYALSLHRVTSAGDVNGATVSDAEGAVSVVGSALGATTALAKLRYALGNAGGFADVTFRDQAVNRDLSAGLTSYDPASGSYDSFAGSWLQAHNAGYGVDLQLPFGGTIATFRHLTSLVSQSVSGPAADTSPYLYNQRDLIGDDTLELTRAYAKSALSLKLALRTEHLVTDFVSGATTEQSIARRTFDDGQAGAQQIPLGQVQRSLALRYTLEPTPKLHYTLAAYYSLFSTFGASLDPRAGFVWTPNADSAFRLSAGTTFQTPQLTELYVPPEFPAPVNGYITIGNPGLRPDRATEYDLGYEHLFGGPRSRTHLAFDLYQTNVRTPAATYIPPVQCTAPPPPGEIPPCLSYPVNAGGAVYRGFELRVERNLAPSLALRASWGVASSFLTTIPSSVQNGSLVVGEQSLGAPLHKGTLTLEDSRAIGLAYFATLLYEGSYNELNRPPFATLRAGLTWHARGFDAGVYGTNLTNVYATKFTTLGGGVPYGGVAVPVPTDAYAIPPASITFVLSRRY